MRTDNSAQGALTNNVSVVPAQEESTACHDGRLDLSSRARRSAIQAANDRMVYLSGDENAIRLYEMRFKAACDMTSMRNGALREGEAKGLKKGHAEGHAEEKLEIARKMKSMGDSVERIHTITDLAPETIEKL
jgi:predicted transposase/invertase (TIGR01784 family)